MMVVLLGLLAFAARVLAQSDQISVNVGGEFPPITHPQVIEFNSLKGPYQHVVILSIDGFHEVRFAGYLINSRPT
jgi:hypothetical protein